MSEMRAPQRVGLTPIPAAARPRGSSSNIRTGHRRPGSRLSPAHMQLLSPGAKSRRAAVCCCTKNYQVVAGAGPLDGRRRSARMGGPRSVHGADLRLFFFLRARQHRRPAGLLFSFRRSAVMKAELSNGKRPGRSRGYALAPVASREMTIESWRGLRGRNVRPARESR